MKAARFSLTIGTIIAIAPFAGIPMRWLKIVLPIIGGVLIFRAFYQHSKQENKKRDSIKKKKRVSVVKITETKEGTDITEEEKEIIPEEPEEVFEKEEDIEEVIEEKIVEKPLEEKAAKEKERRRKLRESLFDTRIKEREEVKKKEKEQNKKPTLKDKYLWLSCLMIGEKLKQEIEKEALENKPLVKPTKWSMFKNDKEQDAVELPKQEEEEEIIIDEEGIEVIVDEEGLTVEEEKEFSILDEIIEQDNTALEQEEIAKELEKEPLTSEDIEMINGFEEESEQEKPTPKTRNSSTINAELLSRIGDEIEEE